MTLTNCVHLGKLIFPLHQLVQCWSIKAIKKTQLEQLVLLENNIPCFDLLYKGTPPPPIKLHSAMTLHKFHCTHPTVTTLQKISHAGASPVFSFLIRQSSELPNCSWEPKMYQKYVCSFVCHGLRWICTWISLKAWHGFFVCLFLELAEWGYRSIRFDSRQLARTDIGKLVNSWTSTSAHVSILRRKS